MLGAAAWFVLHVVEENHHLAHSGIYSGDGIRVLRYHVSGQSGTLCIPGRTVVVRWSDAGCCLYATDYVTSPMSHKGMLIYGVCIGLLTVIIRLFGAYPEGMSFAILIMNAFTPLINTYVKPKRFGEVAKKK